MIQIDFSTGLDAKIIQAKLRSTPEEARKILVKALNFTAKETLPEISAFAQKTYDVQDKVFEKGKGRFAEVKIQNATKNKLFSAIKVCGRKIPLFKFRTSPATVPTPENMPDFIRAHVLKSSGMKPITKFGNKAFIAQMPNPKDVDSGHIGLFVREGKARLKIHEIMNNSVPHLVGSERVVTETVPKVEHFLYNEINKGMERFLRRRA